MGGGVLQDGQTDQGLIIQLTVFRGSIAVSESEGGRGTVCLRSRVVLPSYLLPTGLETLAPLVKGLGAESQPRDPPQSPKKNKKGGS